MTIDEIASRPYDQIVLWMLYDPPRWVIRDYAQGGKPWYLEGPNGIVKRVIDMRTGLDSTRCRT